VRLLAQEGLSVAWLPTKIAPPQLVGVFFCKAAFPLAGGPVCSKVPLPSGDLADEGGPHYASDFVPFKPRTDVMLRAAAHAPPGKPVRYLQVGFEIASLRKQLMVAGERRWQRGLLGRSPGEPEPFTTLPITWSRALGGPKDRANPIGRGREGDLLPNVEIPGRLVQAPGDRIPPAGFGPIPADWEPRCNLVGTYRGNYLETRWPWYPEDFDFGHFNAAPRDQQIEGYLRGDEALSFEHLHREHKTLQARLPGVKSRLFVTFQGGEFREVAQRLDTLFCDLLEDRLVLVWRGHTAISTPLMHEVVHVLVALEPLGTPRDAEHYRALRDQVPAVEVDVPDATAAAAEAEREAALAAKVAAVEAEIASVEAQIEADDKQQDLMMAEEGFIPPALPNVAAPSGIAAWQAQLARPAQVPPPEILHGHPVAAEPELSAEEIAEIAQLEAELEQEKLALRGPPAWTRERVLAAVAAGTDLQGEDLSGLDLSGCALAGARFDQVVLTNCDLGRADLRGATLRSSVLTGANLAHADLSGAVLDGADCREAAFAGARLTGASLASAILEQQKLAGMDLSGCRGEDVHFAAADLNGCRLAGAAFTNGDFTGCKLAGADCVGAVLQKARLHGADASGANFQNADLRGLRGDDGCNLAGADFKHANLDGVVIEFGSLRGADLRYASMRRALLTGTDLGQSDLSRADLERTSLADANLAGARLLQTNLRYACLERAEMKGADARWANFYGAGLWETKTELCDLREANLASTLLTLR